MRRNGKLLRARNQYIIDKINKSDSIKKAIHEISSELFISEKTIYRIITTTDTIVERVSDHDTTGK